MQTYVCSCAVISALWYFATIADLPWCSPARPLSGPDSAASPAFPRSQPSWPAAACSAQHIHLYTLQQAYTPPSGNQHNNNGSFYII
eukprot:scaffold59447_cov19-Prasinocladus_malaysianus.AAC.1